YTKPRSRTRRSSRGRGRSASRCTDGWNRIPRYWSFHAWSSSSPSFMVRFDDRISRVRAENVRRRRHTPTEHIDELCYATRVVKAEGGSMYGRFAVAIAGFALAASTAALSAHHAFSAEFDAQKPVKFQGTVTRVEWINPHSWIHVSVKQPSGKVEEWM